MRYVSRYGTVITQDRDKIRCNIAVNKDFGKQARYGKYSSVNQDEQGNYYQEEQEEPVASTSREPKIRSQYYEVEDDKQLSPHLQNFLRRK